MNEISVSYSRLSETAAYELGIKIHKALSSEPCLTYFPVIDPSLSQLAEQLEQLRQAIAAETSSSVAALRKSCRQDVVDTLTEIAGWVEQKAHKDVTKLAATGFELKKKPQRSGAPIATPLNLRLSIPLSGEVLAKCKAVHVARSYHLQYSLSANGPWIDIPASTSSQKMLISGLQRGVDIYVRVKAFGANGYSDWSDIATIMVV